MREFMRESGGSFYVLQMVSRLRIDCFVTSCPLPSRNFPGRTWTFRLVPAREVPRVLSYPLSQPPKHSRDSSKEFVKYELDDVPLLEIPADCAAV